MKVLFIGNYKECTGYGTMARRYLLAMDAANIDVVPRHLTFNPALEVSVDDRIYELEQKDDKNCDICVQVTLPEHFRYNGHFHKNIGIFCYETSNFISSDWAEQINTMDEVWVPCKEMIMCCQHSHVQIPVKVVPVPCDSSAYYSSYTPINLPNTENTFKFYFIGELIHRKNLKDVLIAFYSEFEPYEDVSLVVKTYKQNMNPQECIQRVQSLFDEVKSNLKLYNDEYYKTPLVIVDKIQEEDILKIHQTCNCLVAPSKGESWGLHIFDAMGFGNTPITTDCGGPRDFMRKNYQEGGYFLNPIPTMVYEDTFDERLYTAREWWYDVDIMQLRTQMRQAFKNKDDREQRKEFGIARIGDYNYDIIGKQISQMLEE